MFAGPVKVDESYFGGREENKHESKRLHQRGGAVGKAPVVGAKDRATNRVSANVINHADKLTLQGFIRDRVLPGVEVYTDEHVEYRDLIGYQHASVRHTAKEYVNGIAHTNSAESFWALLKRSYHGTFHHLSEKHLNRYVGDFAGRHNIRSQGTITQMASIAKRLAKKRLRYQNLVA